MLLCESSVSNFTMAKGHTRYWSPIIQVELGGGANMARRPRVWAPCLVSSAVFEFRRVIKYPNAVTKPISTSDDVLLFHAE